MRFSFYSYGLGAAALMAVAVPASSQPLSVEERLQRLEDQAAVERLVSVGYSAVLDVGDSAGLAALFTPDGEFDLLSPQFPPKEYKGRAAIEKQFGAPTGEGPPPPELAGLPLPVSGKHVITNVNVTLQGDTAKATSYYIEAMHGADGKLMWGSSGYYQDDLQRIDGRWYIARRVVHDSDLPKKPR